MNGNLIKLCIEKKLKFLYINVQPLLIIELPTV